MSEHHNARGEKHLTNLKKRPSDDSLRIEYREIGNNMRYYTDLRFKGLALMVPLTGALIVVVTQVPQSALAVAMLGVLSSLAFLIMERRASDHWTVYLYRGLEIERRLSLKGQYHKIHKTYVENLNFRTLRQHPMRVIWKVGTSATFAAAVLHGLLIAFWLYVLFYPWLQSWLSTIALPPIAVPTPTSVPMTVSP